MAKMIKDVRGLVEEAQREVAKAKSALVRANAALSSIMVADPDKKAGNAAMRFRGALRKAQGIIDAGHSDASDFLIDHFDDGAEMVTFGGGTR